METRSAGEIDEVDETDCDISWFSGGSSQAQPAGSMPAPFTSALSLAKSRGLTIPERQTRALLPPWLVEAVLLASRDLVESVLAQLAAPKVNSLAVCRLVCSAWRGAATQLLAARLPLRREMVLRMVDDRTYGTSQRAIAALDSGYALMTAENTMAPVQLCAPRGALFLIAPGERPRASTRAGALWKPARRIASLDLSGMPGGHALGLAVDDRRLFVFNSLIPPEIQVYDIRGTPSSPSFIRLARYQIHGIGALDRAGAAVIGNSLCLVDVERDLILRFSADQFLQHQASFGGRGQGPGKFRFLGDMRMLDQQMHGPLSLAVNKPRSELFVPDEHNNRVQVLSIGPQQPGAMMTFARELGRRWLKQPRGVCYARGRLYVIASSGLHIMGSEDGTPLQMIRPDVYRRRPNSACICADSSGRIYVTDFESDIAIFK